MNPTRWVTVTALGLAVLAAACTDSNAPITGDPLTDTLITADVAATSGDAIASDVETMIGNEAAVGFQSAALFDVQSPEDLSVTRSRTCYDATGAVQAQCDAQTTDSIRFVLAINGTRSASRSRGTDTATFTVSVHRSLNLTVSGLLGTETSRTHNGTGASNDTSAFTGTAGSRSLAESSSDSIQAVMFQLPRASNPWPVSGSIVRNVSVDESMTINGTTKTRSGTRRVQVTFPADAQGNVSLLVNDKACSLNLVTHRVTCPA